MIDPDGKAPEKWPPIGDAMRWGADKLSSNGYNRAAGFVNSAAGAFDAISTMGVSSTIKYTQGSSNVSGDNSFLENAALIDPSGISGAVNTVVRATGDGADAEQAQGEILFTVVTAAATRGATGKGGGGIERTSSLYENTTTASRGGKGKSYTQNRTTDVTKTEFGNNLNQNGFSSATSGNGTVNVYSKDGKSYTVRDGYSKRTGGNQPTADFRKDATSKNVDLKIRLKPDQP